MSGAAWYRDRPAWRFIALRFLPWFAGLSLAWEIAHTRFYTIWTEASPAYLAYSIAHCTLGDLLIGLASLALALTMAREGRLHAWRLAPVATLTTGFGTAYTIFSEWMNVRLLQSWTYADSMPTLPLGGFEMGLTPLLQWLLLPTLALVLSLRATAGASHAGRTTG
jgi:hypothetical protein